MKDSAVWYLPHHPVFHPRTPGKARMAFDCAAKCQGTSLTDQLLEGPDLTNGSCCHSCRCGRHAPSADCNALMFLWWPNDDLSKEPVDYQMLVHLFEATSPPSWVSFCLKKTALDNQGDFDVETITTVDWNFYVDDCLESVPTTEKAARLSGQLRELLLRGGFWLTEWISNDKNVIATVPVTERAPSVVNLNLEDLSVECTLGVQWAMETDDFNFHSIDEGNLSVVSSVYDPLGFVASIILPAKSLLQSLCKQKYGWDEEISHLDSIVWQEWLKELACLRTISVPRCFKPPGLGAVINVQLHHFSDASENGYGVVSYLRTVDDKGAPKCSFFLGKSRTLP